MLLENGAEGSILARDQATGGCIQVVYLVLGFAAGLITQAHVGSARTDSHGHQETCLISSAQVSQPRLWRLLSRFV